MTRGKKKVKLGRSLMRQRERQYRPSSGSDRHTTTFGSADTAISITENTSLDEFLSNAEAAQRSFEAERGNAKIVRHEDDGTIEEESEPEDHDDSNDDDNDDDGDDNEAFSSIPKKPNWTTAGSTEEYHRLEQISFLKWKKKLNRLQVRYGNLPPFEKNLEFWRQLWKMLEISDIVVQVVDARDPIFYYSQDLANYVQEMSPLKTNVMLVNKADFLTQKQREIWSEYFQTSDMKAVFFSALEETNKDKSAIDHSDDDDCLGFNLPNMFSPSQFMNTLKSISKSKVLSVGFLGYPNVGKSSSINCFLTDKKLPVSATPGKTKHYQTHVLGSDIQLVDGPGLVIPNLNMSKADMMLAGILPIDNLTHYLPAMDLLLTKVPFAQIQKHYGIMSTCVSAARKSNRKNESLQILSALGLMRGFMKPGGVPDDFKAAKIVLKDFVQGKLTYCKAPPSVNQEDYFGHRDLPDDNYEEDLSLEESFPELRMTAGVHLRGSQGPGLGNGVKLSMLKKNKRKEKARRLYRD